VEFAYEKLRRHPDVEAPNLQAWDATDELLVAAALAAGVPGDEIAVIGDGYGAITLALADAGMRGLRVHQDLVTGRRALARNAEALGLDGFREHELDESLLTGIRLVLLQLPKSLAELDEIADAVARWASPGVTLIAGGRVKHMTRTQNDVLARHFGTVQAQRAERKSRLLVAAQGVRPASPPPFPISSTHVVSHEKPLLARETTSHVVSRAEDGFSTGMALTLCAYGGAFSGDRIDIGTRVLLDVLDRVPGAGVAVDLGCGTGALAAAYARRHSDASVLATDRSAAAVRSARATMAANHLVNVEVTLDDAASEIADSTADLVLLNPPFHLGTSIHTAAATRLFQAAARVLKPGGELWTVYNSSLGYRGELIRLIGQTEQIVRTPKFTVTRTIRR
jgi:16S rRNA (guanine1207-N2)-methyltransferase